MILFRILVRYKEWKIIPIASRIRVIIEVTRLQEEASTFRISPFASNLPSPLNNRLFPPFLEDQISHSFASKIETRQKLSPFPTFLSRETFRHPVFPARGLSTSKLGSLLRAKRQFFHFARFHDFPFPIDRLYSCWPIVATPVVRKRWTRNELAENSRTGVRFSSYPGDDEIVARIRILGWRRPSRCRGLIIILGSVIAVARQNAVHRYYVASPPG